MSSTRFHHKLCSSNTLSSWYGASPEFDLAYSSQESASILLPKRPDRFADISVLSQIWATVSWTSKQISVYKRCYGWMVVRKGGNQWHY